MWTEFFYFGQRHVLCIDVGHHWLWEKGASKGLKMKGLKHIFWLLFLASPLSAFAHGEDVLVTVLLEFLVVLTLAVGLVTINLNGKGKLIVGGICILAVVLTFMVIDSLPYDIYRTTINILVVFLPLTIGVITYFGLKNRFQKK